MSAPRANPLHAGYDETLLSETPEVSRAAKQEGYNVDLLDGPSPLRGAQTTTGTDPESMVLKEHYNTTLSSGAGAGKKVPWWRTRDGMIAIAVLVIIVVGAVVGGAVGGTVGKHKNNSSTPQQGISNATTPRIQPPPRIQAPRSAARVVANNLDLGPRSTGRYGQAGCATEYGSASTDTVESVEWRNRLCIVVGVRSGLIPWRLWSCLDTSLNILCVCCLGWYVIIAF
ncbi:hypothetical protein JB92DRAFT_709965 [Gautieria morchelliformis]|nr:hypothetical protein JB92DRAFT_709965 [Gautieria morchelliformis]